MPKKPARKPSANARVLTTLVKRSSVSKVAKRLKVPQKTLKRWLSRGVPKTKLDTVKLAKLRSDRSQKAGEKRSKRLRAVAAIEGTPFNLERARKAYRDGDLDLKARMREARKRQAKGEFSEIAEDSDLSESEVYTIFLYSGGEAVA